MIIIHYGAEYGTPIRDGEVADYVDGLLAAHSQRSNVVRMVCQGTIVQELRLRVARGELPHTDLQFSFKDQTISVNEHAVLSSWPKGFADLEDRQVTEIITLASKKPNLREL